MRFCEPVYAIRPSMTTIFRWLRRSGRWYLPLVGWTGSIHVHSTPMRSSSASISLEFATLRVAMKSISMRTLTPRLTASSIAVKKPRVVSSQPTMKYSTWTKRWAVPSSTAICVMLPL